MNTKKPTARDLEHPYCDAIHIHNRSLNVARWYPRVEGRGSIDTIDVELVDVRAASGFRIQYDFERDGYVLSREIMRHVEEVPDALGCTDTWREIAFVPSDTNELVEIPPATKEDA